MASIRSGPVAPVPDAANEQHYELPTAFMRLALGPRMKYSCCWYEIGDEALAKAEDDMLALTCARAELSDGLDILELGCGWGSLTLWMAERYPRSRIVAVSNSAKQRQHITDEAQRRRVQNVTVITADMNDFSPEGQFDRVVSVEMFEHMRNYLELMRRVSRWLEPGGKLFVHIFCHRRLAYPFVDEGDTDWMARHFFTGGLMPSERLLVDLAAPLRHERLWTVSGRHYARTCNQWLESLDRNKAEALALLRPVYGKDTAVWFQRWRLFYMACSELFAFGNGTEWHVGQYLFANDAGTR